MGRKAKKSTKMEADNHDILFSGSAATVMLPIITQLTACLEGFEFTGRSRDREKGNKEHSSGTKPNVSHTPASNWEGGYWVLDFWVVALSAPEEHSLSIRKS
ncbi:hypothetical protein L3X38_015101 [Prunus dulcis]|uniref:Uncharacterized protein n=1 Tax=Prunus dulcis TaxID=3755 RepID=A0AAD4WS45_PRUDU|nr:hypothetical protein L3X38_015101 [Prunus dulcis]